MFFSLSKWNFFLSFVCIIGEELFLYRLKDEDTYSHQDRLLESTGGFDESVT